MFKPNMIACQNVGSVSAFGENFEIETLERVKRRLASEEISIK